MGRPRGNGKKSAEAASNDDDGRGGGGGGEEAAPTHKRNERPQKPLKDDDADGVEDVAKVEDDGDSVTLVMPSKDHPKSAVESNGGKKRRRRRRRQRQVKGSSDSIDDDGRDGEDVGAKPNGFRRNGSRRKSTPRRAAEAGVECK